ncbi:MAG: hypothetical protein JNL58_20820 [Planctomyces sp.]|nr:hypothetical protein [Planctomyces sp.]
MIMQNNDGGHFDREPSRPPVTPVSEEVGRIYGFVPLDPNAATQRLDVAHRSILRHHLNQNAQADVTVGSEPFGQTLYFG